METCKEFIFPKNSGEKVFLTDSMMENLLFVTNESLVMFLLGSLRNFK